MPKHTPTVCILSFLLTRRSVIRQFMHVNLQRSSPKESTGQTITHGCGTCWTQVFQTFNQHLVGLKQVHKDGDHTNGMITLLGQKYLALQKGVHFPSSCIKH